MIVIASLLTIACFILIWAAIVDMSYHNSYQPRTYFDEIASGYDAALSLLRKGFEPKEVMELYLTDIFEEPFDVGVCEVVGLWINGPERMV